MKGRALVFFSLFTAATIAAQSQPASPQPAPTQPRSGGGPAELQNVRVLKGLTPPELVRVMQFVAASLGVGCDYCHITKPAASRDFVSDDKEEKRTAREMMRMVIDTNAKYFHGRPRVSCTTCHRGNPEPLSVLLLPVPAARAPAESEPTGPAASEKKPSMPTRDDLVSRYAKALGPVDAKALASMQMKGTRETEQGTVPIEVLIASGQTRYTVDGPQGETAGVVSTDSGWVRDSRGTRVMPPVQHATTRDLFEAMRLILPAEIPPEGRVSKDRLNDKDVWVLSYPLGNDRQRLYFDAKSGLLLRRLTLIASPIGLIPQETDYDDYRAVGTFKLPFLVRYDSADRGSGRTLRYSEIQPNAQVDPKVFQQPQ